MRLSWPGPEDDLTLGLHMSETVQVTAGHRASTSSKCGHRDDSSERTTAPRRATSHLIKTRAGTQRRGSRASNCGAGGSRIDMDDGLDTHGFRRASREELPDRLRRRSAGQSSVKTMSSAADRRREKARHEIGQQQLCGRWVILPRTTGSRQVRDISSLPTRVEGRRHSQPDNSSTVTNRRLNRRHDHSPCGGLAWDCA